MHNTHHGPAPTQPVIGVVRDALAILVFLLFAAPSQAGGGTDLHRMWDDRCAECHGHSGEFARKYLDASDGRLAGTHHIDDLRLFLTNHYLPRTEVDAVYEMLRAQAGTEPRFRDECAECHRSAVEFVRESLELRGGVLYGRATGKPVDMRGVRHHDLSPDDVAWFTGLLVRVARETGQR